MEHKDIKWPGVGICWRLQQSFKKWLHRRLKVWSTCLPIFIGSFHLQKYQQSPSFCLEHVPCANLPCSRSPNGRFDFVQVNMPILCSFHGTGDKWWRNIVVAMCERCSFRKYVAMDILCNYTYIWSMCFNVNPENCGRISNLMTISCWGLKLPTEDSISPT